MHAYRWKRSQKKIVQITCPMTLIIIQFLMTTSSGLLSDVVSSQSGNVGRAGLTIATISAVYRLTQRFIEKNVDKATAPVSQRLDEATPPASSQGLPTVQEGDEANIGSSSDTPEVVLGRPDKKHESTSPPKITSLTATLITIFDLVGDSRQDLELPAALAAIVFSRSVSELFVYKVTSQIDECIVKGDKESLNKLLTIFLLVGIPSVGLQQLTHFMGSQLSSRVRESLTGQLMKKLVLSPHNLNHPEELVDQDRMEALLTDINQASSGGVQLATDRIRKIIDVVLQLSYLVKTLGVTTPVIMLGYLYVTVRLTVTQKRFKPIFSRRVSDQESILKKVVNRLTRHRDDIAVWGGATAESESMTKLVKRVEEAKQVRDRFEYLHCVCQSLCSRVGGTALGFALIGAQFMKQKRPLYEYFLTGRVMLQMCNSVSSLIEDELVTRMNVQGSSIASTSTKLASAARRLRASLVDLPKQLPPADQLPYRIRKTNLCLNDVTAVSPDGPVLFQSLSFELSPGSSLLVHGQKNCGKSALLRVIAGTWPVVMGEISRPRNGVFCVPSKPYLMLEASLKEQICYPDSVESLDPVRMETAVSIARISHLFTTQGKQRSGVGTALLGEGDLQQLMIARLVYHRPKYALLDDCWRSIDQKHLMTILNFLKSDLKCGLILATQTSSAKPLKAPEFGFPFDLELVLSNGKQPPRHEIIVHRTS